MTRYARCPACGELAAAPVAPAPPPAPVELLPPTNAARPAPKPRPAPRVAAPAEPDPPEPPAADWRRGWSPFEPPGLRLRVSLPGDRRTRAINFPLPGGATVPAAEVSGEEGPARYRLLTLAPFAGPLTTQALSKQLAGLRPDVTAPAAAATVGGREVVTTTFLAHDGREWLVHATARGRTLVLLVRSLDRAAAPRYPGFDAAAGLRRFLESVEWLDEE